MTPKHLPDLNAGMSRRRFLAHAALATTGCTAYGAERLRTSRERVDAQIARFLANHHPGDLERAEDRRPNILVITTDQQWAGAMSCVGNPHVRTPAMDRLACDGFVFESAYTPNPICVPARTSYMTGTPSHENGVVANVHSGQVELTKPCLASVFRAHGYDTGHAGKWHIPRSIEDSEWSGFNYRAALRNNRVDFDIPESCAEFMLMDRDTPFFLIASFVNPHDICEWARILSGIDDDLPNGDIGPPPPPEQCPPLRPNRAIPAGEPGAIREHQQGDAVAGTYPTRDWAPEDGRWRQYLWGYYRMVELVDAYIGQVLDALDASGQTENTVIVFSSDHGDGMGSHRWNQKTLFYDEVARVPFIVSWKGQTRGCGRDRTHLVNIGTDLFPTLFDFADIPKPAGLRGISAAPVALGQETDQRHAFIVSENNLHAGFGKPTDTYGRMIRSERYKYIRYNRGTPLEQLFDLALDPGEMRDLADDEASAKILDEHRRMLDGYLDGGDP